MRVKDDSVNIEDLVPEVKSKLEDIERIYNMFNVELVITSGKDGKHGNNSLHYRGRAVDTRTYHVLDRLVNLLRAELGPDFEVVLEKDHIHIEYDPNHDQVVG